jgi:hypothetical protein
MAFRTFFDSLGRQWEAWTVSPEHLERRASEPDDPARPERRRRPSFFRPQVAGPWAQGWLAFEAKDERRRLAPYPPDWDTLSDHDLEELCQSAVEITPLRRLLE